MSKRTCNTCARAFVPEFKGQNRCPEHYVPNGWGRSPGPQRDRAGQARFRKAVLARANFTCEECGLHDPSGKALRAAHRVAVVDGGSYALENGACRCVSCDRRLDRYAR